MSHDDRVKARALLARACRELVECDGLMQVRIGSFVGSFESFVRGAEARVRDALSAADL